MNLLGKKVKTLIHPHLCENYSNLDGIIVNYKEEPEIKRNPQKNNEPIPTGKIIKQWQIKFNSIPQKEMSKSLWLHKDMFEIVK